MGTHHRKVISILKLYKIAKCNVIFTIDAYKLFPKPKTIR